MIDEDQSATMKDKENGPRSSRAVLAAIRKAEDVFREWQVTCQVIDDVYSLREGVVYGTGATWRDAEMDIFWSSFEIMKPAIYARPPQPVVAPMFKDGKPLNNTTAELLERCSIWTLKNTHIGDVMTQMRDDLLFTGRGVPWLRYEVEGGEHRVCVEHKDRLDFLHEPGRYWCEVGWVSGAFWLTKPDMRKRFSKSSGKAYQTANYTTTQDERDANDGRYLERRANAKKCKVWEVWHKADNKVYWVTEGVDVFLDESEPEIELADFFPCPRPAYATLQRRSLIPSPDYERYARHFDQINELTRRIYSLLDGVRMKGLIPAGGDVGEAVENLIKDDSNDTMLVPVPAGVLMNAAGQFVQWLPLAELATAITGLIDARAQLIEDFYQLSGISDIMRGATESDETLGAQQLKSQYGSVRVREKSAELQRVAADAVKIASEIIAEKFPQKQLLEMSQMDIPTKADIAKRIKSIEEQAKAELEDAAQKAQEASQQENADPAQVQGAFQQAQQEILARFAPMLAEAEAMVPIEDVMKLLRDDRARSFVFEIESSSTILTDELEEKRSRNEFLDAFTKATQSVMTLAASGEAGAKLAGAILRFVLAPYRAGRDLDGAIEEFIDKAPELAKAAAGQEGEGEELMAAQKELAEAEKAKAAAAMASVEARSAQAQADNQRKVMELQQRAQNDAMKAQQDNDKLRLQLAQMQQDGDKQQAEIDKLRAQTAEILNKIGLDVRKQELSEYQAAEQSAQRETENAFRAEDSQRASMDSDRSNERAERAEERADRGEDRADRQQEFAERAPQ